MPALETEHDRNTLQAALSDVATLLRERNELAEHLFNTRSERDALAAENERLSDLLARIALRANEGNYYG